MLTNARKNNDFNARRIVTVDTSAEIETDFATVRFSHLVAETAANALWDCCRTS
jgi:hypothetical protein